MDKQQKLRRKAVKFETLKQQQQKKRFKRRIFYIILLLVVTIAFFAVCFTVFFKIGEINITGNEKYSTEEIIELIDISQGDNLYSFNAGGLSEDLAKALPYIKSVAVTRSLPSTVNIEIIEEDIAFYTYINNELFYLTESLTVLERSQAGQTDHDSLIRIDTGDIKRCIVGERLVLLDTRKTEVLEELFGVLNKYELTGMVNYVNIKNRFDIMFDYEEERFKVYIGDINDCDIKIQFLCGILEKTEDDQKGLIDISNKRQAYFTAKE